MNKNNLCIKINSQEQINFLSKTLENIGFKWYKYPDYFNESANNYFLVDGNDKDFFVIDWEPEDYVIKDSWRELILEYLKDFYVKCSSAEEKLFILEFFNIDYYGYSLEEYVNDLNYPFVAFNRTYDFQEDAPYGTKPISFNDAKILLNSITKYETLHNFKKNTMNKDYTKPIGSVDLSAQEAAFLCAVLNNDDNVAHAIKQQGCEFMLTNKWRQNKHNLWEKINNIFKNNNLLKNNGDIWSSTGSKHFFEPQFQEFSFKNGLTTKTNLESREITIGCQKNTVIYWYQKAGDILNCGLDKFTIEGYDFEIAEIKKFYNWLNEIK